MANKNRRKRIQGYVIPVPVVSVLVVAMLLLLAYVGLDVRSKALGTRIKALEQQQVELQKKYDLELSKWERTKSPQNIERILAQGNCSMIWPDEANIVRLNEAIAAAPAATDFKSQMAQLSSFTRPIVHD
jgi:hypothetical protein